MIDVEWRTFTVTPAEVERVMQDPGLYARISADVERQIEERYDAALQRLCEAVKEQAA